MCSAPGRTSDAWERGARSAFCLWALLRWRLALGPEAEATAPEGATGVVVSHAVARDYWVAWSERAGVLWVFQTRLEGEAGEAWFLHGHFA